MDRKNEKLVNPGCSICSKLDDKEYAMQKYGWDDNTSLPEAANRLVVIFDFKPGSDRKKILEQCNECGTFYLYETDYEYLVNGSEDEESLTRLSGKEAEELLRGANLR